MTDSAKNIALKREPPAGKVSDVSATQWMPIMADVFRWTQPVSAVTRTWNAGAETIVRSFPVSCPGVAERIAMWQATPVRLAYPVNRMVGVRWVEVAIAAVNARRVTYATPLFVSVC